VPRAIPSSRSASARWSSTSRSFSACSRASRAASSRCHLQQPVTVRVIYIINQVVKIVSKQLVRGIIKACKSKRAIPIRIAANRQRRQSPSHTMFRLPNHPATLAHCHACHTVTLSCMPHGHVHPTAMHTRLRCTPDCDAPQTAMHTRLPCKPPCHTHVACCSSSPRRSACRDSVPCDRRALRSAVSASARAESSLENCHEWQWIESCQVCCQELPGVSGVSGVCQVYQEWQCDSVSGVLMSCQGVRSCQECQEPLSRSAYTAFDCQRIVNNQQQNQCACMPASNCNDI
jgi:hypothetical protein